MLRKKARFSSSKRSKRHTRWLIFTPTQGHRRHVGAICLGHNLPLRHGHECLSHIFRRSKGGNTAKSDRHAQIAKRLHDLGCRAKTVKDNATRIHAVGFEQRITKIVRGAIVHITIANMQFRGQIKRACKQILPGKRLYLIVNRSCVVGAKIDPNLPTPTQYGLSRMCARRA